MGQIDTGEIPTFFEKLPIRIDYWFEIHPSSEYELQCQEELTTYFSTVRFKSSSETESFSNFTMIKESRCKINDSVLFYNIPITTDTDYIYEIPSGSLNFFSNEKKPTISYAKALTTGQYIQSYVDLVDRHNYLKKNDPHKTYFYSILRSMAFAGASIFLYHSDEEDISHHEFYSGVCLSISIGFAFYAIAEYVMHKSYLTELVKAEERLKYYSD